MVVRIHLRKNLENKRGWFSNFKSHCHKTEITVRKKENTLDLTIALIFVTQICVAGIADGMFPELQRNFVKLSSGFPADNQRKETELPLRSKHSTSKITTLMNRGCSKVP